MEWMFTNINTTPAIHGSSHLKPKEQCSRLMPSVRRNDLLLGSCKRATEPFQFLVTSTLSLRRSVLIRSIPAAIWSIFYNPKVPVFD